MTAIDDIWQELSAQAGRFGLAVGEHASETLAAIAVRSGLDPLDIGRFVTIDHPDGWMVPEQLLRNQPVLDRIEVLFWPDVPADPLRLLTLLARRHPVIAAWPGSIDGRRARYSEPGRPDHYDQPLPSSAIVLRSIATAFPDEPPYEVERT